jgi:hypothetical protein
MGHGDLILSVSVSVAATAKPPAAVPAFLHGGPGVAPLSSSSHYYMD